MVYKDRKPTMEGDNVEQIYKLFLFIYIHRNTVSIQLQGTCGLDV